MTNSIDAPLPPPTTVGYGTPPTGTSPTAGAPGANTSSGTPSTADTAKDEARNVQQTAAQAGSQVASTAADQAKEVAQETQRQAKDLLDQSRSHVRDQAQTQQQKAAAGLTALAQELRGMVDGEGGQSGPAHDLLHQASGKVEDLAGWLQDRDPADVLDDVRRYARRKPGTFLLGAAVAGVLVGRLTSGVKAAHADAAPAAGPAPTSGQTPHGVSAPGYVAGPPAPLGDPLVPPAPRVTVRAADSTPPPVVPAPPVTSPGWDDPARRPGGVG